MDINPVILSIPLYFLLIGAELLYQQVKKIKIYRTNDALANIGCGITSQISGAIWGVVSIGIYQWVYTNLAIFTIENSWWTWLMLFVLVDLCYYWFHRASHEVNFLWNTSHVVHHQSEDYNLSVALRQSSFGGIFSILFYLPLAVLGFSGYAFLFVKGLNLIYQFWIHTEAIDKMPRWFEFIFNTPSHHRVHHGRNPKYIDKNHAGTLMIWDRMFGTFQREEEKPTYGVTKPTNTWNPVWANVMPVVDMIKQISSTPGVFNKVKVLCYKPGWQPEELGGYQSAPEVDEARYQKYDVHPLVSMTRYVFIQFLIALVFTSYFLFTKGNLELNHKLAFAGFIIWTIAQIGVMMENRKKWFFVEYVRIIVASIAIYLIAQSTVGIVLSVVFAVVCLLWFKEAFHSA